MATTWHVEEGKVVVGSLGIGQINDLDPKIYVGKCRQCNFQDTGSPGRKTHKVIFGLNPEWIFEGKIVPEKLSFCSTYVKR